MNNSDNERSMWGGQNVGAPANEVTMALGETEKQPEFECLRFDAVEFYVDNFLCRELLNLIDETLATDQLRELDPGVVKVAMILMLRDMMQQHRSFVVSAGAKQSWDTHLIEQFTARMLQLSDADPRPYVQWITRETEDDEDENGEENSALLISGLARQLGLEPKDLYVYHMTACEVVLEDFFGASS